MNINNWLNKKLHLIFLLFFIGYKTLASDSATVTDLKTEHLVNPLGIDVAQPRFTWRIKDSRQGAFQLAYRMIIDKDSTTVANGKGEIWDTGKVTSPKNLIGYEGAALQPFTKYYWTVMVWDMKGIATTVKTIASFETGMMRMGNWRGSWISDSCTMDVKPAPMFRKEISVSKNIKSARVYIAAAGLFELSVNGEKIGNHMLDPMFTRFDRRNLYITHDVTTRLKSGKNVMGVMLGNGWYNHQSTAVWDFHKAAWRARPAFCLDLRITYTDGSEEIIGSGSDWKTSLGPVVFNSIYTAEHYDANFIQAGWNTASFNDKLWKGALVKPAPSPKITAQVLHPVRDVETIQTKSFRRMDDTLFIYDFGRNISGVSELTLSGDSGTIIRLVHAEQLNKAGFADISNIDYHFRPTDDKDPFQTDMITLSGKGVLTFRPKFNYKGFRYVQISSNKPVNLNKNSLVAYFMHSDVPEAGKVSSSNKTLNKIWEATNSSYLSNLFGYPTDCPQREKNGWTGDAHIAVETGLYSYDAITIYEKWLADHRDEQQPNGILPAIIPTAGWGYAWANGPDWTSTITIIPWQVYLFYGDSKILADKYDKMKRYVDNIHHLYPQNLTTWGLGDWVPVKTTSTVELTSSIYYYTNVQILAKAAGLLGHQADHQKYKILALAVRNAINNKYLNRETGIYASGTQTELSAPLFWNIVPENLRSKVASKLAEKVRADGNSLDVGLLGSKTILNALSENGFADIAYALAAKETYPSWGWWIKNGATTLHENWDVNATKDNSMNHIMFGEIGAWYYKALGGIKPDETQPGFKNILLSPNFVAGLESFPAGHRSPNGDIVTSWKRKGKRVSYDVTIPPNSTAHLQLKDAKKITFFNGEKKEINVQPNENNVGNGLKSYYLTSGTYSCVINMN